MVWSRSARRLRSTHRELVRAREELAVVDEQLAALWDEAHDAEGERHVDAMTRSRTALLKRIADLERTQDELLDRLPARPR